MGATWDTEFNRALGDGAVIGVTVGGWQKSWPRINEAEMPELLEQDVRKGYKAQRRRPAGMDPRGPALWHSG